MAHRLERPRRFQLIAAGFTSFALLVGCSNQSSRSTSNPEPSGSGGGTTGGSGGGVGSGGSTPGGSGGGVGQEQGEIETKLPGLPKLSHVFAQPNDDSVTITFDPVDGALDYRVYPLPDDSAIELGTDGSFTVQDGTYRCAGNREVPAPNVDSTLNDGAWVTTRVDQQTVGGYTRTLDEATLGYVYTDPAPGLVPVYALGESNANADNNCYFARWAASRVKLYTPSEDTRAQMLSDFARDDGVAFYVPAQADSTTTPVYMAEDGNENFRSRYYFTADSEASARTNASPAFDVLTEPVDGTEPLMRVFYENGCGWSHDELAVGQERFNRVREQGDLLPAWELAWSGMTEETTLVVEALDSRCPYQGFLAPQSMPAQSVVFGEEPIEHEPYLTLDEMRSASATGEVFVNGQGDVASRPKAIARSFVKVTPEPHVALDYLDTFSVEAPETFTTVADCGSPDQNCGQKWRLDSEHYDITFLSVESATSIDTGRYAVGSMLGEFWVAYADVAADTNGKFRMTAKQKANLDASSFLHVTMEVDAYSTSRRYPQILISDREAPVQYHLQEGHTLVIQTFGQTTAWASWPVDYQLQVCSLRSWDVNDQCPTYDFHAVKDDGGNILRQSPNDEVGEHASVDHRTAFDVYASTSRVYLFLAGKPYGCADLPAEGPPSGAVTVTWGDVLYHSAVDMNFQFHVDHMQFDTRRHYDNLGFESGVAAPAWDEARLPCMAAITL
jgi:hypothetical protein